VSEFPEHDKLQAVKERTQAIGEFLDWAGYEKGVQLAQPDDRTGHMYPIPGSWMDLLAEWAGIDRDKLEDEKRQMLETMRRANGG
jgi:hypothetical protein